jgi:hypothetical protein
MWLSASLLLSTHVTVHIICIVCKAEHTACVGFAIPFAATVVALPAEIFREWLAPGGQLRMVSLHWTAKQ